MDKKKLRRAIHSMLVAIEGEPLRQPLLETPLRAQRGFEEMLSGYDVDIPSLFKVFDGEGKDQIVITRGIETYSFCEHHVLPFFIRASVAYLPKDRVIGVSKMGRLVNAYAHRLQLQERLTEQVAKAIMDNLQPQGVGVVIVGEHLCMRARGVKNPESEVVTSVMLGEFRENHDLKHEVLELLRNTR